MRQNILPPSPTPTHLSSIFFSLIHITIFFLFAMLLRIDCQILSSLLSPPITFSVVAPEWYEETSVNLIEWVHTPEKYSFSAFIFLALALIWKLYVKLKYLKKTTKLLSATFFWHTYRAWGKNWTEAVCTAVHRRVASVVSWNGISVRMCLKSFHLFVFCVWFHVESIEFTTYYERTSATGQDIQSLCLVWNRNWILIDVNCCSELKV